MHKIGNIAKFVFLYLQSPSLVTPYDVSKCKMRCKWVQQDYISRLHTSLV